MKWQSLTALFVSTVVSTLFVAHAETVETAEAVEIVEKVKTEKSLQHQHNVTRESLFKKSEIELTALKTDLERQRDTLNQENDDLATAFSRNEESLARLEEQLRLEVGSLGEVFGVVRQNAKELQVELESSVTAVDAQNYAEMVEKIVAATELPSLQQLDGLWQAMKEQISAGGEVSFVDARFVDGDGVVANIEAARLGAFGLVSEDGYLKWNTPRNESQRFLKQPKQAPTVDFLYGASDELVAIVMDPSRGQFLEQLALTPTMKERIEAGGAVGKAILVLLSVGLLIALVRGITLLVIRQKIRAQLKSPQQPGNNPLGRVLSVYSQEKKRSVEALELRLMEAVVDELTELEKGLSMLKLLAALAPMLGLLGTVTGMIETFQVITQFGNGDPKVMAGGISMALITTVLGLVAAIPLLLTHNILSSQAESIRNIIEKQGIGMVAEQAEKDQNVPVHFNHSVTEAAV